MSARQRRTQRAPLRNPRRRGAKDAAAVRRASQYRSAVFVAGRPRRDHARHFRELYGRPSSDVDDRGDGAGDLVRKGFHVCVDYGGGGEEEREGEVAYGGG